MISILIVMALGIADEPLSVLDLDGYHLALATDPNSPATPATFRELWNHPDDFAGKRVRVSGRVARVFRQAGVGEFPAMVEAWLVTPSGDPTCLVFPEKASTVRVGADVAFSGTYLRRIRYKAGDVDRLVPLIVGPEAPGLPPISSSTGLPGSASDWAIGMVTASVFVLFLARRHLAKPVARPLAIEPAPRFLDSEPDPTENGATHEHGA